MTPNIPELERTYLIRHLETAIDILSLTDLYFLNSGLEKAKDYINKLNEES